MSKLYAVRKLTSDVADYSHRNSFFNYAGNALDLVADSPVTRTGLRAVQDFDDEVKQCLGTRLSGLLTVDYILDGLAEDAASELLKGLLEKHYVKLVSNAFTALSYGFSVQECVWVKEGDLLIPDRIDLKPFEWFDVDRYGNLYYDNISSVYKAINPKNKVDTQCKFFLTRSNPTFERPLGDALLGVLYWPYFYRSASWRFWMQFLERSGQPMLVGYSENTKETAEALESALMDATISLPSNAKVEMLENTNRGESFDLVEQALVRRIQKVVLGQTLTSDTGAGGTGSKALGDVHDTIRTIKITSDLALVQPTLQNFINAFYSLNYPFLAIPKIRYGVDKGLETARANRDAMLVNSGQVKFTKEYYVRNYGFAPDDFELPEVPNGA